jgi:hypothetical protein
VSPSGGSVTRHSASLHWLLWATVRQLRRYYQSAPTSHRPSRLAPFRSLGGTTHCCSSLGSGELLLPAPPRNCAGASILSLRLALVETTGSPRFPGNPFANMPCSSTRRTGCAKATNDAPDVAVRGVDGVGSAFSHLSRLNHTPVRSLSTLCGSDYSDRHHARLASHWRPTLFGRDSHPLGC